MNDESIGIAIARAERAAAGIADPIFRAKAFEVVLNQLLAAPSRSPIQQEEISVVGPPDKHHLGQMDRSLTREPKTLSQRILALQAEGFFGEPREIATVREGLGAHGWHYPVTTLSGVLQSLTQKRRLRRERVREGRKMMWKYSNP